MRKIILSMHISLDGFVAGPNGEMDWIRADEEIFEVAGMLTDGSDTALYGRVTYQMMESYWPTAAEQPAATKHDIQHAQWYNNVEKVVLSRTIKTQTNKTRFVGDNAMTEIKKMKSQEGENILMFGSPTAAHSLMKQNLVDEYWLFINPVILGKGIPLFAGISGKTELDLQSTHIFACGVVALNYTVNREK